MRRVSKVVFAGLILSACMVVGFVSHGFGQEYEALKGVKSVKAFFDVRTADPKGTAMVLNLVHQTFKDGGLTGVSAKPAFVVGFMGSSVTVISKTRKAESPEEARFLDEIAVTVSEMSADGIELEVCVFALKVLGVDPSSILPEIKQVGNGWISLIGYQARGYSLAPAY